MCHTEDEERSAQLETEFLTTLYILYQSVRQSVCLLYCSHYFLLVFFFFWTVQRGQGNSNASISFYAYL